MKWILCLLVGGCAQVQEPAIDPPQSAQTVYAIANDTSTTLVALAAPRFVSFGNESGVFVSISLDDGSVTLDPAYSDADGAQAFWNAVTAMGGCPSIGDK